MNHETVSKDSRRTGVASRPSAASALQPPTRCCLGSTAAPIASTSQSGDGDARPQDPWLAQVLWAALPSYRCANAGALRRSVRLCVGDPLGEQHRLGIL